MGFEKSRWGKGNPFWVDRELNRRDNMDRPPLYHSPMEIYDEKLYTEAIYAGHLTFTIYKVAYLLYTTQSYNGTSEDEIVDSNIQNLDISSFLPTGITHPRAIVCGATLELFVDATKVKDTTSVYGVIRYSNTYNSLPHAYGYLIGLKIYSQSDDADDIDLHQKMYQQCHIPVVYNGNDPIPYISYQARVELANMTSENEFGWGIFTFHLHGIYQ